MNTGGNKPETPPEAPEPFPPEVLSLPAGARQEYFEQRCLISHPRLLEALETTLQAICPPGEGASTRRPGTMVLVFGPTGVGKTTLLAHIEKRLIERALPRLEQDRSHLPVVKLEAAAPSARQFRWPDFYNRALISVRETLVEDKVKYDLLTPKYNAKLHRYVAPRTGSMWLSCG